MFGRFMPGLRPAFLRQVGKTASPRQFSYPLIPQDWMYRWFPNHTRDKLAYMVKFIKVSMIMGFCIYWFYHTPYAGTHDCWESPWYKAHYARIRENGTLARNQAIAVRHSTFYDGGEDGDELESEEIITD